MQYLRSSFESSALGSAVKIICAGGALEPAESKAHRPSVITVEKYF